ncbi:AsmA family protein [Rhodoplanes sp. SY1]|uniref:AsmA family protein n=1 Tax=Rhodoplanes sp. SY1 TaxID=3166646 RepID=UPI0038B5D11C
MSVPTGFKRLAAAVSAVVLGGLVVLGLASYLVSVDAARDAVTGEVRAVTGLEPTVRGTSTLSMFPSPRIALGDVALAGYAEDDSPFVAEALVANVRWLPLLLGRIEIADIALVRPHITVRFDADGRSNWSPLVATLALAMRPDPRAEPRSLSFSEIRITDGTVVLVDAGRGVREALERVELSLAWPSIAKSFAATGRVTWRDEPLDLALAIADFPAALVGETSGLKLRVGGVPLKAAFEGAMSLRPSLKIDGTLAADAPSLRGGLGWVSGRPFYGVGLGRFALKAKTNVVSGTVALSSLNIELDGNAAEGVLTWGLAERRSLQGTLAVDTLDLTPYAAALRLMASDQRAWNRKPLSLDWFDDVDLDLRISAARVLTPQTRFGRTAMAATLQNQRLVVTVGEAHAFNGVVTGSLALDKTADGAAVRSQLSFRNVDLETCLSELIGVRRLEGKGNVLVSLDGAGSSVFGVTRTLNGRVSLTAANGALVGVNVEQLLRRLERRPLGGGADFRSGRTPFDSLAVVLKVSNGTAQAEDVRLQGTNVRLAVAGTASVPSRELDLTGTASLLSPMLEQPPTFELPFFVQGSWDDPMMLPDTQALIRRSGAAAPLLDSLSDKRTRDAVRSAIDRLGGGDGAAVLRRLGIPAPAPTAEPAPAATPDQAPAAEQGTPTPEPTPEPTPVPDAPVAEVPTR